MINLYKPTLSAFRHSLLWTVWSAMIIVDYNHSSIFFSENSLAFFWQIRLQDYLFGGFFY